MRDIWNFLQHTGGGRALVRGMKTFLFTFCSMIFISLVVNNSFDGVAWLEILGTSGLASMGMSAEKYRRAVKNQ